ncbi:hypothetical protein [Mesorhizobium sp. M1378]|uniref:hypothetical protein n=1 Tax=Mesorhizobium sp. M1378 TaxID=2957092 RepID=UPI0033373EB9
MKKYVSKVFGAVVFGLLAAYGAFEAMVHYIHLALAPEDAAKLIEELSPVLVWLTGTPWWVPTLSVVLLSFYVLWAFWPDFSTTREIAKLRAELTQFEELKLTFHPMLDGLRDEIRAKFDEVENLRLKREEGRIV